MGRLERLIRFSLRHRWLVLAGAGLLTALGAVWIAGLPVDIFPDLSAPTVTVITEAPGMAPEEVELFATFPLESALNGAPNIRRVLRQISRRTTVSYNNWLLFAHGRRGQSQQHCQEGESIRSHGRSPEQEH